MLKVFKILFFELIISHAGYSQTKKPNIIFILPDDLGYSDVGTYGGEIHTPNLDKMAQQSVKLSNMHNASMCVLNC